MGALFELWTLYSENHFGLLFSHADFRDRKTIHREDQSKHTRSADNRRLPEIHEVK